MKIRHQANHAKMSKNIPPLGTSSKIKPRRSFTLVDCPEINVISTSPPSENASNTVV